MPALAPEAERLRARLADDTVLWARHCAKIVDHRAQLVPLAANAAQLKFDAALEGQRAAGKPMRAIVLKARKLGFCLDPATRVLTADLRWIPIDEAEPGQQIVATDEDSDGVPGGGRRLRRGVVEAKRDVREEAFELTMSDGRKLIATAPHRFLCLRRGGTEYVWRTVAKMRPGDRVRSVVSPWGESSHDDGWFGGMIDGEGSLRSKAGGACGLAVYQRPGEVYDRAASYLSERGYTFAEYEATRSKPAWAPGRQLVVSRSNEMLRLVGQTRPTRFVDGDWWEGRALPGKDASVTWGEVASIKPLGRRRMVDLQTSAKTFIAEGFVSHNSTWVQAKIMQRVTQREYRRGLVVAQDNDTAGELLAIGERIWKHLPDDALGLKPQRTNFRRGKEMVFGDLDSTFAVDTAREAEAGRGFTYTDLHLSEVAFWPYLEKMASLLNAVPDDPGTMVVLESTANGSNHFKVRWDRAVAGESEYVPIFAAWHEDSRYRLSFDSDYERERFEAEVGAGPWGDDEPRLVERFGCDLEQLHWRRYTIVDKCDSNIELFKQEYPASADEAFVASGKQVFSPALVSVVIDHCEQTDPPSLSPDNPGPEVGTLEPAGMRSRKTTRGMVEVPTGPKWVPRHPKPARRVREEVWRVFERPQPGDGDRPRGQYVAMLDPAEGEETAAGENAYHAITVIDHRTRALVAELQTRIDPDLVGIQLYLAALYFNNALVCVEKTGGYGLSVLRQVNRDFGYPRVYRQKVLDKARQGTPFEDRLGWDTNRATKALIEDGVKELIRRQPEVFRSHVLAHQLTTYIKLPNGKTGPEENAFSDLLMAFGVAQQVAMEWPVPTEAKQTSTSTRPIRNPIAGY